MASDGESGSWIARLKTCLGLALKWNSASARHQGGGKGIEKSAMFGYGFEKKRERVWVAASSTETPLNLGRICIS